MFTLGCLLYVSVYYQQQRGVRLLQYFVNVEQTAFHHVYLSSIRAKPANHICLPVSYALLDVIIRHWTKIDNKNVEYFDRDLFHDYHSATSVMVYGEFRPHSGIILHHLSKQLYAELRIVIELTIQLLLILDDSKTLLIDSNETAPTYEYRKRICPSHLSFRF